MDGEHLDESEQLELASGLLKEPRKARVLAHLGKCALCRRAADEVGRALDPSEQTVMKGASQVATPHPSGIAANPWKEAEPTNDRDSLVGMALGDYQVSGVLGEGGMGMVYAGMQPMIGKPVAIKVLRPEFAADPAQMKRLLAEARAVNAIRHPGIIDIFGFGQLPDGRQYFVMELLKGEPLDAVLERGKLALPQALDVLDQTLSALSAAHAAGVIHRDLKPSNIFLADLPEGGHYVKLLDFGLAKVGVDTQGGSSPQTMNLVVGTPAYMAPEQARGEAVGPRTDLYALGIVAFELVTGKVPFSAPSSVELMIQQLNTAPPRPRDLEPSLPVAFEKLLLSLLAKLPDERPASAAVVRKEVVRLRREAGPPGTLIVTNPLLGPRPTQPATEPPAPGPRPSKPRTPSAGAPPRPAPLPETVSGAPLSDDFVPRPAASHARLFALGAGVLALLLLAMIGFKFFSTPTPVTVNVIELVPPPPRNPPPEVANPPPPEAATPPPEVAKPPVVAKPPPPVIAKPPPPVVAKPPPPVVAKPPPPAVAKPTPVIAKPPPPAVAKPPPPAVAKGKHTRDQVLGRIEAFRARVKKLPEPKQRLAQRALDSAAGSLKGGDAPDVVWNELDSVESQYGLPR